MANELSIIYKCKVSIIPNIISWDMPVTKYHNNNGLTPGATVKYNHFPENLLL